MGTLAITIMLGLLHLMIFPTMAFSSGFFNGAQSAKAFSMGNAFVAQADDPTAIFFNPAGIVQLEGTQVALGTSVIAANVTFKSDAPGGTVAIEKHVYFVPYGYLTYKFNDFISLGLGSFSDFGLSADWPDSWQGRFINGATMSRLTTYAINPVIAIRPHPKISFAAGPVIQYVDFKFKNRTLNPFTFMELDTQFSGSNWSAGFSVGMLVWISDNLKCGFCYRSQIRHTIANGRIAFNPQATTPYPGINFTNTSLRSSLKTPAIMVFGMSWNRGPLTVEVGAQFTEWSSFRDLTATFNAPVAGQDVLRIPKNWRNAWEYHFGLQYALLENFFLRAGFIYDMGSVPATTLEPLVPFGDRKFYTCGLGYKYKGLTVDLCYSYMDGNNSTWNNAIGDQPPGLNRVTGKFEKAYTNMLLTTLSYKF